MLLQVAKETIVGLQQAMIYQRLKAGFARHFFARRSITIDK